MHQANYDESGNSIDRTLYETYLSKLIIENPKFYQSVFNKINASINRYIEYNQKIPYFDRMLFSVLSRYSEIFPQYKCIQDFTKEEFNVEAHVEFHKHFFELLFPLGTPPPALEKNRQTLTLSEIVQQKISSNEGLRKELAKSLRPKHFFSESGRSRIEIQSNRSLTRKLGIAYEEMTPTDLKEYYPKFYENAQNSFKRNYKGFFSNWMKERDLPFISGPSGTLEILFCSITQLDTYSPTELKQYFMAMASAFVARGHHSYAEVMIVAEKIGFELEDISDKTRFYEQFLTQEVLESEEYRSFLADASFDKSFRC